METSKRPRTIGRTRIGRLVSVLVCSMAIACLGCGGEEENKSPPPNRLPPKPKTQSQTERQEVPWIMARQVSSAGSPLG